MGAVLEIDVAPNGTLRGHRWRTGGEALDLLQAAAAQSARGQKKP